MGSMVWSTKGKNGKRWDLGNIKWQNIFKVQIRDGTTVKNMQKHFFSLAFFLFHLIWRKIREKKYFVKTQDQCQKKRADIWNLSIVDSIGQMNHYCGNWRGDVPQDILQPGALLYYILPPPSPTPRANGAKTDNESMKGGRIGLLGQIISIFIF